MARLQRPRVLFLATWYPTSTNPVRGTFVREHALAAARYADVRVLHVRGVSGTRVRPVLEEERDPDVTAGLLTYVLRYPRPLPRTGTLSEIGSALWAFRKISDDGFRPDVVHASIFSAGLAAAIVGGLHRIPVLISEHSSAFTRRTLSRQDVIRARWAFARANRVLPVSEYLRDAIASYGIRARFQVVSNAVDTALFHPGARQEPTDTVRLLFVGHLESDQKGLDTLLLALSRTGILRRGWSLQVVGNGDLRSAFESQSHELGLSEHITFRGLLSRPHVAAVMQGSNVLVAPSREPETQGCVILEALASGLPVIASSVGAFPESVTEDVGWLVPPGDPHQLAVALEKVITGAKLPDPDVLVRKADKFSAENVGRQLLDLYQEARESP